MPTVPTHAAAAVAIGTAFPSSSVDPRWWAVGAVCAMAPDADVIGFRLGVRYGDFLGHRGFSHSLVFAALLALATSFLPLTAPVPSRWALRGYLFLAAASHGLLDALTDGGLGIALLAPFDDTRYFFPVRPIAVSPIGLASFFTRDSLAVVSSELLWVWLPGAVLAGAMLFWRRSPR